jgi:hypothetical protein
MNWQQLFDRFHFDDHGVVDDQVHAIADIDSDPVVMNRERFLGLEYHASRGEFLDKASLVGTFEKAGTQPAVDSVRGSQNAVGYFSVNKPRFGASAFDRVFDVRSGQTDSVSSVAIHGLCALRGGAFEQVEDHA